MLFLKAGALATALTLVAHTNEEIVLGAVRLASQILQACPREAQESAAVFFKEQGSETFF